jgi:hypothetical protein
LTKIIKEHKDHRNVIPIKNELLGFCNDDCLTAILFAQLLCWQDKTKISGGWINGLVGGIILISKVDFKNYQKIRKPKINRNQT